MKQKGQLLLEDKEAFYEENEMGTIPTKGAIPGPAPSIASKSPKKQRSFWRLSALLLIFAILPAIYFARTFEEAVVEKADGTYELSPARKAKRDAEVHRLEHAEQYALTAKINAWYICYSCMGTDSIYLYKGEVWKYGFTTKGQLGRYSGGLPDPKLAYIRQYTGTLQNCLVEEKRKIYNYPLLAENLKRRNRLIRPPGNKQDN